VAVEALAGLGIGEHLGERKRGWEEAGHRVRGAALAWMAARSLQDTTGIQCQALVSLEADIEIDPAAGKVADPLAGLDVVVDETGINRHRKGRLVTAAREAGARLILVRDPDLKATLPKREIAHVGGG
jgi:hypothetical protein